jgi:SLOG cluster3 family
MNNDPIFLSASVPERELDRYVSDPVSIREAVRALVAETVRDRLLVFGGHPAISPLVEHAARDLNATDNVHIYQSRFFEKSIPDVAKAFKNLIWTNEVTGNRVASLTLMRDEMIRSQPFAAAVFIGGMDGLDEEWALFTSIHPKAPALPVASTEGAARLLWQNWVPQPGLPPDAKTRLEQDLQYRLLFRDVLK